MTPYRQNVDDKLCPQLFSNYPSQNISSRVGLAPCDLSRESLSLHHKITGDFSNQPKRSKKNPTMRSQQKTLFLRVTLRFKKSNPMLAFIAVFPINLGNKSTYIYRMKDSSHGRGWDFATLDIQH